MKSISSCLTGMHFRRKVLSCTETHRLLWHTPSHWSINWLIIIISSTASFCSLSGGYNIKLNYQKRLAMSTLLHSLPHPLPKKRIWPYSFKLVARLTKCTKMQSLCTKNTTLISLILKYKWIKNIIQNVPNGHALFQLATNKQSMDTACCFEPV